MPETSIIDHFMPTYSMRQVDRVAVAASPERAYETVRAVDLYRVGFVRALFELRVLPERIAARARRERYAPALSSRIEDITRAGSGFQVLGEAPGREVVVGAIGKFWKTVIPFARVTPSAFAGFDEPGFGRLAWNLRVDPRESGGSFVSVEVRVGTTDPATFAHFRRYWALVGPFSHAIRRSMLRLLVEELGAAEPDDVRTLPGDDILAQGKFQRTHAVTIEAPPARVWPWLVQMGARRAGWYSFDLLDNGGTPSAREILPEHQHLAVGDLIPGQPNAEGGFMVLRIEPERALVIGDPALLGAPRPEGPPWQTTWAFALEPIGADATRLTVRVRAQYENALKMVVLKPLMTAVHEIMERRQLHNLRRRAEAM